MNFGIKVPGNRTLNSGAVIKELIKVRSAQEWLVKVRYMLCQFHKARAAKYKHYGILLGNILNIFQTLLSESNINSLTEGKNEEIINVFEIVQMYTLLSCDLLKS